MPSLKIITIHNPHSNLSSLQGLEKALYIEIVGFKDLQATTNLQALEQLPNLKMILLYSKPTGNSRGFIDQVAINNLKNLTLPAGVKLLQMQYVDNTDNNTIENVYFVELGYFSQQNRLSSHIASMKELDCGELNQPTFVANQDSPLPTMSVQTLEAIYKKLQPDCYYA